MRSSDLKVKVITNYLPQYHRIPENDNWWGEGYTDWVATKNAKPLFEGHRQPRIPLNNYYYDLSDANTIRWQAELARKYGVYGFGIYHYWFNSDLQLLQKPAELLLQNKDIDIHFMFMWDNGSWARTWSNIKGNAWAPLFENKENCQSTNVLAELVYGSERDWEKHFEYLVPFFQDRRYIKIDGKPVFVFFATNNKFPIIKKMRNFWDSIALKYGLPGIVGICQKTWNSRILDYNVRYLNFSDYTIYSRVKTKILSYYHMKNKRVRFLSYDDTWGKNLTDSLKAGTTTFLSGMVKYDDTPRRGLKGLVVNGSTPQKFQKYFTELLKISKQQGKEYVFCPAWNEWGEGMYLEPDTVDGYAYLEALKAAVDEVNGE